MTKISNSLGFFCYCCSLLLLQNFAHVFTEYGNCYTFNHGQNIQDREKVSSSGKGLKLVFNVRQVLVLLKTSSYQDSYQTGVSISKYLEWPWHNIGGSEPYPGLISIVLAPPTSHPIPKYSPGGPRESQGCNLWPLSLHSLSRTAFFCSCIELPTQFIKNHLI